MNVWEAPKVPIIIKLIKLCGKLDLDCEDLSEYAKDNPVKFGTIFYRKKANKSVLMESLNN